MTISPAGAVTGLAPEAIPAAAYIDAILRFETALARAQASLQLIPREAAASIEAAAADFVPDIRAIGVAAFAAGTPVVELLDQFGSHVAGRDREARAYLHLGATSQDALDTATVLCLEPLVSKALVALNESRNAGIRLARAHVRSPMLARTLLQAAGVTTFGFKVAQWSVALGRCERRLRHARGEALVVQLAGSIGSGQAFGDRWEALQAALARELGLATAEGGTWQMMRDAWVNLLTQLALATGVAAKIAGDVALMSQSEIREAAEPMADRGRSSAMPHKQNPVRSMRIRACAHVVQGLTASLLSTLPVEHERGLGTWQAELSVAPPLVAHALAALESLNDLLNGLHFDASRAQENIEATRGLVFSERAVEELARPLTRAVASRLVDEACRQARASGSHLRDALETAIERESSIGDRRQSLAVALDGVFDPRSAIDAAERAAMRALGDMEASRP